MRDANGNDTIYHITGEDEAHAPSGRIAPNAPLACALIGAEVGDVVIWRKPSGDVEIEVLAIALPGSPA